MIIKTYFPPKNNILNFKLNNIQTNINKLALTKSWVHGHLDIFLQIGKMPYSKTNAINIQNYGLKTMAYLEMPFIQKTAL